MFCLFFIVSASSWVELSLGHSWAYSFTFTVKTVWSLFLHKQKRRNKKQIAFHSAFSSSFARLRSEAWEFFSPNTFQRKCKSSRNNKQCRKEKLSRLADVDLFNAANSSALIGKLEIRTSKGGGWIEKALPSSPVRRHYSKW